MRKFYVALVGVLLVMTVFITTASAHEGQSIDLFLTDNGTEEIFTTQATTVAEFFEIEEIKINPLDVISHDLQMPITQGMHIEINRSFPVYVRLDGGLIIERFEARPDSILSMFVNDLRIATGKDYFFDRTAWHKRLSPREVIELSTVRRETAQEYEDIPFEREYVEVFTLHIGQEEIVSLGVLGKQLANYNIMFVAGEEYSRTLMGREIISEPVTEIVHIGAALPPNHARAANGEVFSYARSLTMEATAYTLSFECTGRHPGHPLFGVTASGMMAQVGVVAVDTNVIPFHTRLYIEGYGFAIAGDRGGAIRGDKVDLFFDTRDEVRQFGRRHIQVWILDEI